MNRFADAAIFLSLLALVAPTSQAHAMGKSPPDTQDAKLEPFDPAAAERGLHNLLSNYYIGSPTFLLTPKVFENLHLVWPKHLKDQYEAETDPKAQRKLLMDHYGLSEAEGDNQGAPLGYVPDKKGRWRDSCLMCHADRLNGQLIIGRPNARLDYHSLLGDIANYRAWFKDYSGLTFMEKIMVKSAYKQIDRYANPPAVSRGVYDVALGNVTIMSYRTQDLEQKIIPTDLGTPTAGAVRAQPWWNTALKGRHGIAGWEPFLPRTTMIAMTTPFIFSGKEVRSAEPEFKEIYQYIRSLESPKYPGKIDSVIASRGRHVFENTCSRCHGTYEGVTNYPAKTIPIEVVQTDDLWLKSSYTAKFESTMPASWIGYYGAGGYTSSSAGYMAPPLRGVWAMAPYFHNGSVPTLYHVLHPTKRPTVWKISDLDGYDFDRVGMAAEELDAVPSGISAYEKRSYVDTRLTGRSNGGHTFADDWDLSEDERSDLLEYLKTL